MISFKQFLSEKAMNASEFSKVEKRQGEHALVGFEFECIVTENSPILGRRGMNRAWIALDTITDFTELSEYFDIGPNDRKIFTKEYDEWLKTRGEDKEIEWWNFIEDEYGTMYKFVNAHSLLTIHGWEADTGQASARVFAAGDEEDALQKETFENIENELSDFLGASVTTAWRGAAEHYARGDWLVVPDGSIEPDDQGVGAEINSPPQKLSKALADLKTMFKWMSANSIETNESTGLHINISMPGIQNADLVKLVLFMGDKFVLKQFNRLNSTFTRSQAKSIMDNVSGKGRLPREAKEMVAIAREALSNEKYSSVHIEKLKHGYLEFRIAGGVGYHLKYDLIRDTVLRFVSALELAVDPAAERQEYLKKLSKILAIGEESQQNHDMADRPLTDILEFGDETEAAGSLEVYLQKAKKMKATKAGSEFSNQAKKWIERILLPSLFIAFGILGVEPTPRQRAEFRLILKKLGVDPVDLSGSSVSSEPSGAKKMFGLRK